MTTNPDHGFYKSLITGEITNKKEIHSFEKEGLEIKMYDYDVYCYPNSKTTANLPIDAYL